MASSMILYWGSGSPPCWRVMIALEEKNLQGYQQKLLSFEKNEHKSEPVMAINPRGQLPSFKHGDNIINESFGACLYLENQFKSQGTQLIPDSSAEQIVHCNVLRFADVIYYTWKVPEGERHDSAVKRNKEALSAELQLWEGYFQKVPEGERHDSAVKRNKEALSAELQLWEGYFQKMDAGSYAAGKYFTMADVMVFPQIAYAFRFGLSQEKFPKLEEYHNLVKERSSVQASWPPHWKETPQGMEILKDL
ncbi:UNVERIFIED_CONTAM: hypothetical protein FKN15_070359 [Acipenser sinensis]